MEAIEQYKPTHHKRNSRINFGAHLKNSLFYQPLTTIPSNKSKTITKHKKNLTPEIDHDKKLQISF
ncbi:hypothetical protein V6238_19005 [Marinomonas arenicola]|uniref:hypothetical protein n=1 Tax=Marinomonas arenicola TaxID=569601 RepID=UPI00311E2D6A